MEIFKIIGVGFVTALTAIILKNTKPELSFAVTVTGIIIILLFVFDLLKGSLAILQEIAVLSGIGDTLIRTLLKIVGIAYLTEFAAGIINDFGSASLADKVVLGGKAMIFILSLPIIENLMRLVVSFVELV